MELYFLRHGLAGQHGDPQYKNDSLRPLTAEGCRKVRLASLGMKILGLKFDTILSSPYARARQTAEIVAKIHTMKNHQINLTNNLLPPASIKKLLGEIHSRFPKSNNILLVGHEPHLTQLVSSLLECPAPLIIDFKKAGLCNISIDHDQATLKWLLTPKQLNLLKPGF